MARTKIENPSNKMSLEELIPLYGEQNTNCNSLKKVVADLNNKLKEAIKESKQENTDIKVAGWKCTLTVTEETKVNEEKLIEVLKNNNIDVIKTKEYVDFDALEKLIYSGDVPKEVLLEMDKCNETSTKEVLRCSKMKGE